MALQTADGFASFDQTAGTFYDDISTYLSDAIYFDLNFLEALPLGWDSPAADTVHLWQEDAINADTVISSASIASGGTTLAVTAVTGRVAIGALLKPHSTSAGAGLNSDQLLEVTDISTLNLTVASYSGTAVSYASGTVFVVIDRLQELSNIGSDASLNPVQRQNSTQIMGARDLIVSGSMLARRTQVTRQLQDFVGHQLANRALELRIKLISALIYSNINSDSGIGSDTEYRSMRGIMPWGANVTSPVDSDAEALGLAANLDPVNKQIVDLGVHPDLLLCGTDLVTSINAISATNRRLYESDTAVGYNVQEIMLGQGNGVRVVVDKRVSPGQALLLSRERIRPMPYSDRGMFTIAATDFADGRKRRILAEWTLELRNPEIIGRLLAKT